MTSEQSGVFFCAMCRLEPKPFPSGRLQQIWDRVFGPQRQKPRIPEIVRVNGVSGFQTSKRIAYKSRTLRDKIRSSARWPEVHDVRKNEWCCWRGLNSRPLPYQGSALPLSYSSAGRGGPMLSDASLVKPLARNAGLWHREFMTKPPTPSREERLAEALRTNLRRRKTQDSDALRAKKRESSCPKSAD